MKGLLDSLLGNTSNQLNTASYKNTEDEPILIEFKLVESKGNITQAHMEYTIFQLQSNANSISKQIILDLLESVKEVSYNNYLQIKEHILFDLRRCISLIVQDIAITASKLEQLKGRRSNSKAISAANVICKRISKLLARCKLASNNQFNLQINVAGKPCK